MNDFNAVLSCGNLNEEIKTMGICYYGHSKFDLTFQEIEQICVITLFLYESERSHKDIFYGKRNNGKIYMLKHQALQGVRQLSNEFKATIDTSDIEREINELKLRVQGDNLSSYTIQKINGYIVITLTSGHDELSQKAFFYGRKIEDKIYLIRHQILQDIRDYKGDMNAIFYERAKSV
ncbi:hypothetical protein QRY07_12050 [Bacillus cereus]|uniref:hypothetical protein n=1 Tax=Bacillus cereus TaxID=1396 RepID=UPI002570108F|nr:hypothetical protein [Bacillus cereus]WJE22418.1 hypothetical protein QRY07_12050 [Bacillus cereus]